MDQGCSICLDLAAVEPLVKGTLLCCTHTAVVDDHIAELVVTLTVLGVTRSLFVL